MGKQRICRLVQTREGHNNVQASSVKIDRMVLPNIFVVISTGTSVNNLCRRRFAIFVEFS